MSWFLLKRIIRALFTVFIVTFIIFVLIRVIPGDPVRMMVSGTAPKSAVEALRKELGLDKPVVLQFVDFIKKAVGGDFGESFFRSKHGGVGESVGGSSAHRMDMAKKGTEGMKSIEKEAHARASVSGLIVERFPLTFELIGLALLIGLSVGGILALVGARRERIGQKIEIATVFLQSFPNFWLAIMAILLFSVKLNLFPAVGYRGFKSMVLPSTVLALTLIPAAFKTMYESLKDIFSKQFIAGMQVRGIPTVKINLHIAKHFLGSIVTFLGLQWGPLFGGAIIIEYLFSLPGMGTLFIYAVLQRDYPLIVGGVIALSALFVTLNLVADILYGALDPRVREWS